MVVSQKCFTPLHHGGYKFKATYFNGNIPLTKQVISGKSNASGCLQKLFPLAILIPLQDNTLPMTI